MDRVDTLVGVREGRSGVPVWHARLMRVGLLFMAVALFYLGEEAQAQQPRRQPRRVLVHVDSPELVADSSCLRFRAKGREVLNRDLRSVLEGRDSLHLARTDTGIRIVYKVYRVAGTSRQRIATGSTMAGRTEIVRLKRIPEDTLRIELRAEADGWQDVTDSVNQVYGYPPDGGYGVAKVWLAKVRRPLDWMYLGQLGRLIRESLQRGGPISFLLLLGGLYGIALSFFYHLRRLYLRPSFSLKCVRGHPLPVGRGCPAGKCLVETVFDHPVLAPHQEGRLPGFADPVSANRLRRALESQLANVWASLRGLDPFPDKRGRGWCVMRRLLPSIDALWTLGMLAPLLGLLGTVIGMSQSFGKINVILVLRGQAEAMSALAKGINEALYTTIDGLVVGVFLITLYYVCDQRVKAIHRTVTTTCKRILNL